MVLARRLIVTIALGLCVGVSPALARTTVSTNWAGYAIHNPGASFHQVIGTWRQPTATCHRGRQSFSSYWIGLGGYSTTSKALEQTGTEVDCTAQGRIRTFAWFELVPAASHRVSLNVPPGDLIQGAVTVTGRSVQVSLRDLTRHTSFSKVLQARQLDVTSAEWIVEAPSECLVGGRCVTLPLADFRSATFAGAAVQTSAGHLGSITDPGWTTTRIRLTPDAQRYVSAHRGYGQGGSAEPSALRSQGSAFTVSFSLMKHRVRAGAAAAPLPEGRLVHALN